jgi:hypothetical protein
VFVISVVQTIEVSHAGHGLVDKPFLASMGLSVLGVSGVAMLNVSMHQRMNVKQYRRWNISTCILESYVSPGGLCSVR